MASIALMAWPLIAVILFVRLPPIRAMLWCAFIPYLYLPEAHAIPIPGLPNLNKTAAVAVGLLLGLILQREKFRALQAEQRTKLASPSMRFLILACLGVYLFGNILTILGNTEPITIGPRFIPGARLWDAVSLMGQLFFTLLPFWCAVRYLNTRDAQQELLKVFVYSALVYSLLMLIEKLISPQLHNLLYGFHQHSFIQHIRDGYRPMVFLQHGLWVGFYILMAVFAAAGLWKATREPKWLMCCIWLLITLILSENLGAVMITVVLLSVFFVFPQRLQLITAALIAVMVLVFPAGRETGVIPVRGIEAFISNNISSARGSSLRFRLDNEDVLMLHAMRKPLIGWGGWGRNRVYTEFGGALIAEGRWIQTLGVNGWIGYLSLFGLLTAPVILLGRVRKRKDIPPEAMALALIAAANLIYMIPNSTLTPLCWLVFGALAGFIMRDQEASVGEDAATPTVRQRRSPRHTRFPDGPKGAQPARRAPGRTLLPDSRPG